MRFQTSILAIIYAVVAEQSVGELFIGGIIPGLLLATLFTGYIVVACWLKPEMAPAATAEESSSVAPLICE